MKIKTIIIVLFLITAIFGQDINKIEIDERSEKPMLIGYCDRSAFSDTSFSWWFNSQYEAYEPDDSLINILSKELSDYDITIITGTWCSDSRREVPRFFKILDLIGYDSGKLKIISVGRKKRDITGKTAELSLELVPTFIFYKNGNEKGRIVESPVESLESDLTKILKSETFN